MQEVLGRPLGSHTLVAGPVDWQLQLSRLRAGGRPRAGGLPASARLCLRLGWRRALARGRDAVLLDGDLHLERLRERRARRGVDHALGAADGDVRVGQQLVDERLRGLLELGGLDHAVDQADALGLGGVDQCARS